MTSLRDTLFSQHFAPINELLNDPDVGEIYINSYDTISYMSKGSLHHHTKGWESNDRLGAAIRFAIKSSGADSEAFDERHPRADFSLKGGDRISATHHSVAGNTEATIRCFHKSDIPLKHYLETGIITRDQYDTFLQIVRSNSSLLIAGSTNSGKTTLLRSILKEKLDHLNGMMSLIEHPRELRIVSPLCREHLVTSSHTMDEAITHSLRQNPQCLVLGELREAKAAYALLSGLLSGLPSMLATVHAPDARSVIRRLGILMSSQRYFNSLKDYDAFVQSCMQYVAFIKFDGQKRIVTDLIDLSVSNQ